MKTKLIPIIVVVVVVIGAGIWFRSGSQPELVLIPEVRVEPQLPSFEDELAQRMVDRLIAEDEFIQAVLSGEVAPSTREIQSSAVDPVKTDKEILFDLMAPWVYVNYRKINQLQEGQFLNAATQRKTPWLASGGSFQGAKIASLDQEKALVTYGDATQELLFVPENPPPYDPSVPRTPEEVAAAQRRYYEMYAKRFIKQGKEYARLRGLQSNAEVLPDDEYREAGMEYLKMVEDRILQQQEQGGSPIPPEALIDVNQLTEEQKQLYQTYLSLLQRTPQEALEALRQAREQLENQGTFSGPPQSATP